MTTIILVRHGQSEANVSKHFACRTDTPLSPLGKAHAEALARYLPTRFHIDKIFASPLSRTKNTVLPTAKALGLPVHEEAGLIEVDAGDWENVHTSILLADKDCGFDKWLTNVGDVTCPNGESVKDLFERVVGTVCRLSEEHEGQTLLLGTHWTPLHALLTYADGKSAADMVEGAHIVNASIHVLRYENGTLTPVEVGITDHLDGLL